MVVEPTIASMGFAVMIRPATVEADDINPKSANGITDEPIWRPEGPRDTEITAAMTAGLPRKTEVESTMTSLEFPMIVIGIHYKT